MDEIKEEYQKLAAKYKLPKYEELDKDFLISDIGKTNFATLKVIEKINEKIEKYAGILEGIVKPDGNSISSLTENEAFSEDDKKKVFEIYKKIMLSSRNAKQLILWNDERKNSEFIAKSFDDWQKIKKDMTSVFEKIKNSWEKDIDIKENLGYFG